MSALSPRHSIERSAISLSLYVLPFKHGSSLAALRGTFSFFVLLLPHSFCVHEMGTLCAQYKFKNMSLCIMVKVLNISPKFLRATDTLLLISIQ